MKNKILIIFLAFFLLVLPISISASSYSDKIYDIVGEKESTDITVYFFYSSSCPHCAKENEFLDSLQNTYSNVLIRRYEVTGNKNNSNYLNIVKDRMNVTTPGVPFTVIGDHYFQGYSEGIGVKIKSVIKDYLDMEESPFKDKDENDKEEIKEKEEDSSFDLPLIGKIDAKKVSIPLVSIVLGLVDGFNPCAMWILLFLISMLLNMENRKKMYLLGFTFLFTSAFVYFLAMLGLSFILGMTAVKWVRNLIALVAIIGGMINLKSYINTPKDGCHVVDGKKRKKYFTKIKAFTSAEVNLIAALLGVILLAASVNLIELACSAGFPTIFISILNLNGISGISSIFYILIYILFFLMDDLIVFIIAMTTLKVTGITTKYNRLSHLIGGIIMIIMGILLIFKPEWIMFNF